MTEKNNSCPICKQNGKLLFDKVKDYFVLKGNSPDFSIYYCTSCKIGYTLPVMTNKELSEYYPDEYEAYAPKKSLLAFLQIAQYRKDLKKIKKQFSKNKKHSIFEIGAGRGEFLFEAKKQGFYVEGVEPSAVGREFAEKQYSIRLEPGFGSDIKFKKRYDIIVMRHVLEHINNPKKCLKNIIENGLKEGGLLFLKLPRMDSGEGKLFKKYWHGFDLPRHRVHFSRNGIAKLLHKLRYKKIFIKNEIVPTDSYRSIGYYSKHGMPNQIIVFTKLFLRLPKSIQLFFARFLDISYLYLEQVG